MLTRCNEMISASVDRMYTPPGGIHGQHRAQRSQETFSLTRSISNISHIQTLQSPCASAACFRNLYTQQDGGPVSSAGRQVSHDSAVAGPNCSPLAFSLMSGAARVPMPGAACLIQPTDQPTAVYCLVAACSYVRQPTSVIQHCSCLT